MTLMACYGGPPQERAPHVPPTPNNTSAECVDKNKDLDGDTYCETDCDETNPEIHPGAADPLSDGVDQNCDGKDG
jgi:hypothetical protein